MVLIRRAAGAPHTGYDVAPPPGRGSTPHDELRAAPRPGLPAHAGSVATRVLEIVAPEHVHDRRGRRVGTLQPGDVVPVAKGVGAAGNIVHVITEGRFAGRHVYRHQPGYLVQTARTPFIGGEGPS